MSKSLVAIAALSALIGAVWSQRVPRVQAVMRGGSVVHASAILSLTPGARCSVQIAPSSKLNYPCRVRVACGGLTLYGPPNLGGYSDVCTVHQGQWESAADPQPPSRDGDPRMHVDLRRGVAWVQDTHGGASVEIALDTLQAANSQPRSR
ncbi:MAG: hypothetical protein Q8Q09_25615 [Deltaproteobacteria bacterium]|nr:hypothetical protein [Deltaproteobacteria bacterium]